MGIYDRHICAHVLPFLAQIQKCRYITSFLTVRSRLTGLTTQEARSWHDRLFQLKPVIFDRTTDSSENLHITIVHILDKNMALA